MGRVEGGVDGRDQDDVQVRAAQRGDRKAFEALVIRYQDRIYNACFRVMGDGEEARDCAQETFIKAYRSLKTFRFEAAFGTWLYAIAVNTCRNRLQSAAYRVKRKTIPLHAPADEDPGGCIAELQDPSLSPLEQLSRKEGERRLQRAIAALPDVPRTLIVLRDIEGLSYEELAQATGLELGTVKSGLARARARLRENLKGEATG